PHGSPEVHVERADGVAEVAEGQRAVGVAVGAGAAGDRQRARRIRVADLAADEQGAVREAEVDVDGIGGRAEDRPQAGEAPGALAGARVDQPAGGQEVVALAIALGAEVDVLALGAGELEVDVRRLRGNAKGAVARVLSTAAMAMRERMA